jgi:hypothetical protein
VVSAVLRGRSAPIPLVHPHLLYDDDVDNVVAVAVAVDDDADVG